MTHACTLGYLPCVSLAHNWVSPSKRRICPLSAFGRDTRGIGFLGIEMPQPLSGTRKTRLRITNSRLREPRKTVSRRMSLYLDTSRGVELISLKWPRCFFRCWIRYFSLLLPLCREMSSSSQRYKMIEEGGFVSFTCIEEDLLLNIAFNFGNPRLCCSQLIETVGNWNTTSPSLNMVMICSLSDACHDVSMCQIGDGTQHQTRPIA